VARDDGPSRATKSTNFVHHFIVQLERFLARLRGVKDGIGVTQRTAQLAGAVEHPVGMISRFAYDD
jgi:hypothetical protein